jgi:hypothetical protein
MKLSAVTDTLASVKFAVTTVVIIAIVCVAGTLRPQLNVFDAWWFIGLLCTLAASVFVCSTRRFATVRRTTGFARGRALGSMLTHISILLILAGAVIRGVWGEKGYVEFREGETHAQFVTERGVKPLPFALHLAKFEIETYADAKKASEVCEMDDGKAKQDDCCNQLVVAWPEKNLKAALPVKVGVEQAFHEFKITVLKFVPDFVIDMSTKEVTTRSSEPRNPAILVAVDGPSYQNHRWLFAKFPDFVMHTKDGQPTGESPLQMLYVNHAESQRRAPITGPIKSFKSTMQLVEGEEVVGERVVEVNSPLRHKGYTFYQSGYNPDDLSYTSLQVVNDPGVPVVYAGFGLMIVGLFIVFYLNPWLQERRKKS